MRIELVDIGIAGQYQHVTAHLAVFAARYITVSRFLIAQRLALLEDFAASLLDGIGQALGQFQRVEVRGTAIMQCGQVAWAGDPLWQFVLGDKAQLRIAVFLLGFFQAILQLAHTARQYGGIDRAGAVVDIEVVPLGQLAHFFGGPDHAVPQAAGALQA